MKKNTLIFFILLLSSGFIYSQDKIDSLDTNKSKPIYYDRLTPEESWELHKRQYVKKLKAQGFTVDDIENELKTYEKQKDEFIENLKEQRKIAEINRLNAQKLREEAEIRRVEAKIRRVDAEKRRKDAKSEITKAKEWRNSFENILTKEVTFSSKTSIIIPIIFNVDEKTSLIFKINGSVNSGSALIEFFNPSGKKEGELLLEHNPNFDSINENESLNTNSGSINDLIKNSEIGDWKIKVSAKKSNGEVNISVSKRHKTIEKK